MTTTLSAITNASSSLCSESITVVPISLFILWIVLKNSEAAMGSSCAVGSSSIRSFGCMTITDARFTICFCPPESSSVFFRNHVWMSKKLAVSATLLLMVLLSRPRLSRPKASSCQTLSVTIWLSGSCLTNPISAAFFLSSVSEGFSPS